ncbi:hypothetical protein D0N36_19815 [Hymenobacter lapidiphilus]|uniref:hypothetical protein n=1 Tax=Hymenobacter sp. CCM 8763 TaxID=2303334 RepID=UPI000E354DA4|nr:hypothetical protein [Hymenobacter sp. CCM 8763]RFP63364.1 hypothetical protein D0N36_19815 [Hymenobacter sp. CCM 8763]
MVPILVLVLLTLGLMYWALGPLLLHPGQTVFAGDGDATKNYYSLLYHVRYGQGTHFTGMLYPYGEHLTYADGQPLLGVPLATLQGWGLPAADWALGLMNGLLFLSLVVTAVVVYLLLRRLLLPAAPAVVGALLISFLSPQLMRWMGHYGLAYLCVVPLLWYALVRAFDAPGNWRPLVGYVAVGLLAGLLHPYFLLLAALLGLAYALVALAQRRVGGYPLAFLGRVVLAAVLPVILFQVFMALTDAVTDRPSTPYGFLVYRASFASVFFPNLDPLASFWRTAFHTPETTGEGWAYVGLVGLVVLLLTAIKALGYLRRGRLRLVLVPVLPEPLRIGLYAGLLTLLFACGVPFVFGLEGLLDWIKPLKQFRSIGRFAWIFYYFFTVYAVFYLYQLARYLRQHGAGRFARTFLLLIVAVWAWEARTNFATWAKRIRDTNKSPRYSYQALLHSPEPFIRFAAWQKLPYGDYQAILPLPYFLLGPEQFGTNDIPGSAYEAMRASLRSGLPIVASAMSRTSQAQGLASAQLLSAPEIPKTIIGDFPSRKPLLLLVTNENLSPAEQHLVSLGRLLLQDESVRLYALSLAAFDAAPYRRAALAAAAATPTRPDVLRRTWPAAQPAALTPFGGGSLKGRGLVQLFAGPVPQAQDTTHYAVSVWVRLKGMSTLPILKVRELDAQTGELVSEHDGLPRHSLEVYRGWVQTAVKLRPQQPGNRLEVALEGDEPFEVANLLIRPAYINVYDQPVPGRSFKNNFPLQD